MRRSKALELITDALVEFQEDPNGFLDFLVKEKIYPLKYISNGCLCGHFDTCTCGPGRYECSWEEELPEPYKGPSKKNASIHLNEFKSWIKGK